ncbi:MAG: N-acetylmuramoyl-L-alanine amidase family protein [Firmicutes bacterium]|nr:N-acetylmuramoyl-L-alanine amidase family protein [Bacillota bacterium]
MIRKQYGIYLSLIFFILILASGTASASSPTPTVASKGSGSGVSTGETSIPFNASGARQKTFNFSSCGDKFSIQGYETGSDKILIPTDNENIIKVMEKFDSSLTFDSGDKTLIFTRGKDKKIRLKIDSPIGDFMGQKKTLSEPPRMIDGKIYIAPDVFAKCIFCFFGHDSKSDLYYLDSWVLDVDIETTKRGKVVLVARGTGKLKYRTLKLREPTRFVIDVMNASLDGKAREIQSPNMGPILISQHQLLGEDGNIVRIVIKPSEEAEIVMQQARADNFVEANLRPRQISAPVQDLDVQKITDIDVDENDNNVVITLKTSGPIQIQWTRLLDPDNRFFVDIPGAVFPQKKKEFNLKSDYLPGIRVAQFQPPPDPMVRMVLALESPKEVTIDTDKKNPNTVKIIVSKKTIDPDKAERKGFVVSYYKPAKGMIICIDPGHGGSDPGACNHKLGVYEHNITLDVAKRLKELLHKEGWTIAMTRNTNRDVTYPGSPDYEELGARVDVANDIKAQVFVSIHINAASNTSVNGISTYWYKISDRALASSIQSSLINGTGRRNLGVRRERFHVLRRSKMPSVLVELCFISNPAEAKLLDTPEFRQKAAEAIMDGLRAYARQKQMNTGK